jgi:hypothetical protein
VTDRWESAARALGMRAPQLTSTAAPHEAETEAMGWSVGSRASGA